jgi:hypothetical protein
MCSYCQRPVAEIGKLPCQGRNTMRSAADDDPVCAAQLEEQGWTGMQPIPPATEEQFSSFG